MQVQLGSIPKQVPAAVVVAEPWEVEQLYNQLVLLVGTRAADFPMVHDLMLTLMEGLNKLQGELQQQGVVNDDVSSSNNHSPISAR